VLGELPRVELGRIPEAVIDANWRPAAEWAPVAAAGSGPAGVTEGEAELLASVPAAAEVTPAQPVVHATPYTPPEDDS
jgi:hypothetical protein